MKRIIIADDSSIARLFIKRCLENSACGNAEFIEAKNGLEVIDRLKETSADLVVTDLNMPLMDGVELLRRMKSSPRFHDIPVIIVSSTVTPKKVEELRKLTAFAVLKKPASPASISAAVASLIESWKKESEPQA
jgi:two-component system chemotaxis response regulator CheY